MDKEEEQLFYAISADDSTLLSRLIKAGVDVDTVFVGACPLMKSLWSALHLCCEKGSYECAQVLVKAGACPDMRDKYGQTPLMYSVCGEWRNLTRLLVSAGSALNSRDHRGMTAMHIAIHCTTVGMLQILIKGGADLNSRDLVGRTPLWLAVSIDGHLDYAKILIDAGCQLDDPDARERRTPLQVKLGIRS